RRPHSVPGALRADPSLEGQPVRMPGGDPVLPRARRPRDAAGRESRASHRLEARRHPGPHAAPVAARASRVEGGIMLASLRQLDARWLQIGAVGGLLLFGVLLRDFALSWQQSALCFAGALAAQALWMRLLGFGSGYLSAIVTGIGLSVLVRADSL